MRCNGYLSTILSHWDGNGMYKCTNSKIIDYFHVILLVKSLINFKSVALAKIFSSSSSEITLTPKFDHKGSLLTPHSISVLRLYLQTCST